MRRKSREISVFNLSMLDVICSALGAFVILVIILIQYAEQSEADLAESQARKFETEATLHNTEAELHKARAAAADAASDAETAKAERDKADEARGLAAEAEKKAREEAAKAKRKARDAEHRSAMVKNMDLVFVLDTTSSMSEEIADLQENIVGIVRVLYKLQDSISVGFVAYRDRTDSYLTLPMPLTPMASGGLPRLKRFIGSLKAEGGGDFPEALEVGLQEATRMRWRPNVTRIIVIIGDAPPHDGNRAAALATARAFAGSGDKRKVSVIYASSDGSPATMAFYRQLAEAGSGDYVHDSGRMLESVLLSVIEAAAD